MNEKDDMLRMANNIQTAITELKENLHSKERERSLIANSIWIIESSVRTIKDLIQSHDEQ
jgi:hypothetical protein